MDLSQFSKIVKEKNSDLFMMVFYYLRKITEIVDESMIYKKKSPKKSTTPNNINEVETKIASPKLVKLRTFVFPPLDLESGKNFSPEQSSKEMHRNSRVSVEFIEKQDEIKSSENLIMLSPMKVSDNLPKLNNIHYSKAKHSEDDLSGQILDMEISPKKKKKEKTVMIAENTLSSLNQVMPNSQKLALKKRASLNMQVQTYNFDQELDDEDENIFEIKKTNSTEREAKVESYSNNIPNIKNKLKKQKSTIIEGPTIAMIDENLRKRSKFLTDSPNIISTNTVNPRAYSCNPIPVCKDLINLNKGYLFKFNSEKTELRRFWFLLKFNKLLYFTNEEKKKPKGIISLVKCFLKIDRKIMVFNKSYFCINIYHNINREALFCESEEEFEQWVTHLNSVCEMKEMIKNYKLQAFIGQGKFSVVHKGIRIEDNEEVAVKILRKLKMESVDLESTRREISILQICDHQNIIKIKSYYENYEYIYIVQELFNATDLHTFIAKQNQCILEKSSKKIIKQVVSVLLYLHNFGIVHRDIKPENILINNDLYIKMIDFGLSRFVAKNEIIFKEPFGTMVNLIKLNKLYSLMQLPNLFLTKVMTKKLICSV